MKFTTAILATTTLAVAVSAQTKTISAQWCDVYHKACKDYSTILCGANHKYSYRCYSSFRVPSNICVEYSVDCGCMAAGSNELRRSLDNVWAVVNQNTNGACRSALSLPEPPKDVPTSPVTDPTNSLPNPAFPSQTKPATATPTTPLEKKPNTASVFTAGKTVALAASAAVALALF
ncbi:hypothetical protein BGZ73_003745 [Actinomortierella ambigua]|nr:hypothetical protein BGZ73_003745 [Actinomortierella ambigua]